mgnify:CR=1 FL=1
MKHIIGAKPPAAPGGLPAARLVEVDADSAGQRLDNFLIRHLKGVPKTHVYRIIRSGEVRINKGRVSADTRVEAGDVVRLPPVRISDKVAEKAERPAPAREFPILLEDEHLIAIDKPSGLLVHRSEIDRRETRFAVLVEGPEDLKLLGQHIVAKGLERVPQLPADMALRFRLVSAALPDEADGSVDDTFLMERLNHALDRLADDPRKVVLHLPQAV